MVGGGWAEVRRAVIFNLTPFTVLGFILVSVTALAQAIARQEGVIKSDGSFATGSLGYRLNNPGNLNYAGQAGATPVKLWDPVAHAYVTYAQFDSMEAGAAALDRQLQLDASRGLTLGQRLSTWATANQSAYIRNVAAWLGVSSDTPLSDLVGSAGGAVPVVQPAGGAAIAAADPWSIWAFPWLDSPATDGAAPADVPVGVALALLIGGGALLALAIA